jgi:hypothetical protein
MLVAMLGERLDLVKHMVAVATAILVCGHAVLLPGPGSQDIAPGFSVPLKYEVMKLVPPRPSGGSPRLALATGQAEK